MECLECYSEDNTKRPRLGDMDCLENHEQYICGTCGRCICIDEHPERKLRGKYGIYMGNFIGISVRRNS